MSVSTEGLIWLFAGFAVEMTRRGNRGKVKSRTFPRFPQRLETRTKRGFPHSPSDGGCEYYKGQCSRTARIAGLYRFSRRTQFLHRNPDFNHRLLAPSDLTEQCLSTERHRPTYSG